MGTAATDRAGANRLADAELTVVFLAALACLGALAETCLGLACCVVAEAKVGPINKTTNKAVLTIDENLWVNKLLKEKEAV
jgi:hypothetical protein